MPDIPDRDELEKKIARLLGKLNAKQRAELLELLGNSPSMARIPPSFWTTSQQELATELMPFSEDVYLAAANRVLESVPIGIDWALINQDAANWARSYSVHLAGQINETSRSAVATSIRNSVASFFEEGLTIGELENRLASDPELQKLFTRDIKDRLGRVYGPARAEMIAVTETTRAAAQGEIGVANRLKAEGIEMRKVWQTNKDELVCPICSPLQGVEEREWSATSPDGPPAHPRCRCFLSLLLPKPAGAEEVIQYSTVDEVQKELVNYLGVQPERINLDGLSVDHANKLLSTVKEHSPGRITSIRTESKRNNTFSSFNPFGHQLNINTYYAKDGISTLKYLEDINRKYAKSKIAAEQVRESLANGLLTGTKASNARKLLYEFDQKSKFPSYFYIKEGKEFESMITHELGHSLHDEVIMTRAGNEKLGAEIVQKSWQLFQDKENLYRLSEYSSTQLFGRGVPHAEYIAESWAAYRMGDTSIVNSELLELFGMVK